MPEENLSLPFLHPPGEYFTCPFLLLLLQLFFQELNLKSILIKYKSETMELFSCRGVFSFSSPNFFQYFAKYFARVVKRAV